LVSDNRSKVDSILANLDKLTAKLDGIAGENRADIREVIANIREVSRNLKETIPDLTDKLAGAAGQVEGVISDNREDVNETVKQIRKDAELLEETLESLRTVAKRIEDGEGTVGKLINEDEAYSNLNETLATLNKAAKRAERLKIKLDIHGNYLSELEGTKGYLTMDIQPNPEKFYRLQLVDDPEGLTTFENKTSTISTNGGPVTVTETRTVKAEDRLKFSIQLGRRFHDTTFRLGYIESAFGFGVDHYTLDDDLRWTFDAWELDREENPRVRFAMSYRFLDYFHLDLGGEDLINSQRDASYLIGFGIRFVDEDLKYILASSPVP
jgi:phospholipid/cholesterol/gamma-HCH transport system substrate-binding protein